MGAGMEPRGRSKRPRRKSRGRSFGRFVLVALAACLLGGSGPAGRAVADTISKPCGVPDSIVLLPDQLRRTKDLLTEGKPIKVLAIGSSSTRGIGASSPKRAYPVRFEVELERRFPNVDTVVWNDGVNGELASATLPRLKQDVAYFAPDLVVWQVGTNDAMAGVDRDAFAATLRDGIAWMAERGVDLILMDPQYCPRVAKQPIYSAYVDTIAKVAAETGVPVMRRYKAMRYWAEARTAAPSMLAGDSFHLNDQGYACVAEVLAEGIARLVVTSKTDRITRSLGRSRAVTRISH